MAGKDTGIESLQIWQRTVDYCVHICKVVLPEFPVEEKYALTSQLRRSVQSVPANIAEGYGRFYFQEGVRFCYIARGSLEETFCHLTLANKLGYITTEQYQQLSGEIEELRRMLNGYIAFLKRSKRGENEPGAKSQIGEAIEPSYILENLPESPDT